MATIASFQLLSGSMAFASMNAEHFELCVNVVESTMLVIMKALMTGRTIHRKVKNCDQHYVHSRRIRQRRIITRNVSILRFSKINELQFHMLRRLFKRIECSRRAGNTSSKLAEAIRRTFSVADEVYD